MSSDDLTLKEKLVSTAIVSSIVCLFLGALLGGFLVNQEKKNVQRKYDELEQEHSLLLDSHWNLQQSYLKETVND